MKNILNIKTTGFNSDKWGSCGRPVTLQNWKIDFTKKKKEQSFDNCISINRNYVDSSFCNKLEQFRL